MIKGLTSIKDILGKIFFSLFFLQARREKINARMKLLQELVPGCNKVTYIYIYICVCVCVCVYIYIYIYMNVCVLIKVFDCD